MKSITPNIFVRDMARTLEWYRQLNFEIISQVPEKGKDLIWALITNDGVSLMLQTFDSLALELPMVSRSDGGSLILYITVADVQQLFDNLPEEIHTLGTPEISFYGAKEFSVVDPNNYVLTFAQLNVE